MTLLSSNKTSPLDICSLCFLRIPPNRLFQEQSQFSCFTWLVLV